MNTIHLALKPLSVNEAWQGRRFKTKKYKDYEELCLMELMIMKPKKFKGWVMVKYSFKLKNYKLTDVGNLEKPLSDILVKAGIIEDDRFILTMQIMKEPSTDGLDHIFIDVSPVPFKLDKYR